MESLEDFFEIESTESDKENVAIDRLIDFSANDEIHRFNKQEIDQLKAEIVRVEKMLAKKK